MKTPLAFAFALSLAVPAQASVGFDLDPAAPPAPLAEVGTIVLAASVQRNVVLNRPQNYESWRCTYKAGDVVYHSSGSSEAAARAIIAARVSGSPNCGERSVSSSGGHGNY
jgi:hypothetical protein